LLKALFAYSFQPQSVPAESIQPIINELALIDEHVTANAPEWPLSQINRVDLAVLRLAIFELTHSPVPPKVVIDEAVELGKEFGSGSSAKFINGVLGNFLKNKDAVANQ